MPIEYIAAYYDGILSGVATIDGERYYFDIIDDIYDEDPRYNLFKLTDEEWEQEDQRHSDFEEHVGTHNCLHTPMTDRRVNKTESEWENFYDKWFDVPYPHEAENRKPARTIRRSELIEK